MIAAVSHRLADAVAATAPAGIELRRLPRENLDRSLLDGVELLVPGWGEAQTFLGELPDLRVVQVLSAGTDWIEPLVPAWATLCNARGARDVPVAEWVVGALLGAFTGLLAGARDRVWNERGTEPAELAGATVVIVGYGSIGAAVRKRLQPFGVEVVGVARSERPGVHGLDALPDLLPRADAVVSLTPLTDAARGSVDAAFLARMRDGALFVNAGRGGTVDTGALLAETQSGRLRAVLDVVDPEPLPDDHPLWSASGVLAITPHHAGDSAAADERAARLAGEQIGRYLRGEPLLNVVLPAGR